MTRNLKILMVGFMLGQLLLMPAQVSIDIAHDRLVVEEIVIQGNEITKEPIILRELLFDVGDTILKMELLSVFQRSRENLLNTSLFNFVRFDATHNPGNRIIVHINVTERWYIWPVPILEYAERNFSTFIKNREWDKINYGVWLKWNNFRGRKELLTGKIRLGYINEYALSYSMPNIGRKQQHGISIGFNLNQQNEIFVSTENNKPVEYKPKERPGQIRLNAFTNYTFRRKLYTTHSIRFEYFNFRVSDSVAIYNPNYLGEARNDLGYFVCSYNFSHDVRDSKIYPLEGFAFRVRAEQMGLGIVSDFPYRNFRLTGLLMFHQKLANRMYFTNATKIRYSSEKIMPYSLGRALGYNEFMSGYESYVMDGSDYFISKYLLKFQLVKPRIQNIPFIKMEQFNRVHYAVYINAFADAGFVNNEFPDPSNTMVNTWQFSTGLGIDFVTYYDQVFRIDFAINRYREHGIFFHIETPFLRW